MPAKIELFIACFPVLVDARSWSQVTVRVRASGTWRPCYKTVFEDPGAVGLPRPQPLAPGAGPWACPWRGNLLTLGTYLTPREVPGEGADCFVNIQGADPCVRPILGRPRRCAPT